jgi:hypothetical protein
LQSQCSNGSSTSTDLQDQSIQEGAIISWNSNGTGETNINSTNYGNQSGKGGWSFYNIDANTTPDANTERRIISFTSAFLLCSKDICFQGYLR